MAPTLESKIRHVQQLLIGWFEAHRRDLPWRRTRTPYFTWVSEIMLQQTQVSTVVPYFERWVKKYPDIAALARAPEAEVLKSWEGLGYYSRARNLKRGAARVLSDYQGQLPSTVSELVTIPGIGRYTAGAIASLAFGRPEPVLDGNVTRVLCRLWDIEGDPRKSSVAQGLWRLARQLAASADAPLVNEGLMELGALVCTPKNPECARCPLRRHCRAHTLGHAEQRPQTAPRPSTVHRHVQIIIVRRGRNHVLVHRRDRDAKPWTNLWTFPYLEAAAQGRRPTAVRAWLRERLGVTTPPIAVIGEGKYSITRFSIAFTAFEARLEGASRARLPDAHFWIAQDRLDRLAMPAPHRRLVKAHLTGPGQ